VYGRVKHLIQKPIALLKHLGRQLLTAQRQALTACFKTQHYYFYSLADLEGFAFAFGDLGQIQVVHQAVDTPTDVDKGTKLYFTHHLRFYDQAYL